MDDLTERLIKNAYKRGYATAKLHASVEKLFRNPRIERWARVQAWINHDGNSVKLTKDRSDVIVPDGWPPGVDGELAHEEFVYHHFPEAKKAYCDEEDYADEAE